MARRLESAGLESAFRQTPFSHPVMLKPDVMYSVTYNPNAQIMPPGFGKWPEDAAKGIRPAPGKWVEKPLPSEEAVLIKFGGDFNHRNVDVERAVLLQTNRLFDREEKARPNRLFGYGEYKKDMWYLVLEQIPDTFQSLATYLGYNESEYFTRQSGGVLSLPEALDITVKMAEMMSKLHSNGITKFDFNLGELFWNPATQEVRMVDFEQGSFARSRRARRFGVEADVSSIAHVLYTTLAGRRPNDIPYHEGIDTFKRAFMGRNPDLPDVFSVIARATHEDPNNYPGTVAGSREFYQDLLTLQSKFASSLKGNIALRS